MPKGGRAAYCKFQRTLSTFLKQNLDGIKLIVGHWNFQPNCRIKKWLKTEWKSVYGLKFPQFQH